MVQTGAVKGYVLESVRLVHHVGEPEYVVRHAVPFHGTETSPTTVLAPPRAWDGWAGHPPKPHDRIVTPYGPTRVVDVADVGANGLQVAYYDVRD